MTSIYHQSKEAAAEARLARLNQPAVTAVDTKAQYDRVVAGSNGDESGEYMSLHGADIEKLKDFVSAINRQHCAEIAASAIIFPKPTHSSQRDDNLGI